MLGVGELAHEELDRATAPRDDDAAPRRDELGDVFLGVEVDDRVIGERLAQLGLDLLVHAACVAADHEHPGGRAQLVLPISRTQRAHAKECRPSAMKPTATTPSMT